MKVLDRNNQPLSVGDRVERTFRGGRHGGIVGEVVRVERSLVRVQFPRNNHPTTFEAERRFLRASRCSDLDLLPDSGSVSVGSGAGS